MLKLDFIYNATVKNVSNGDYLDVLIDLGFDIKHLAWVRLYGIKTPDKNSKFADDRARVARAEKRIAELCEGKEVTIKTYRSKTSEYYLAEIFVNGRNVNNVLVTEGLAVRYFGEKR